QKGGGEYFEQREPPRGKRTGNGDLGPIKASYPYTDEGDKLLFEALRFEPVGREKTFLQRRPDGRGGWLWKLDGVRIVPFHLRELIEAVTGDQIVFVTEGEKDVLTLERHDIA